MDARDRVDFGDRSRGSRGGTSDRDHSADRDPRDVFTRDLDLPRGRERRPVRERDRVYEIDGTESGMLATVGAFRVVSESDLHDGREDSHRAQRHLEQEGLLSSSALTRCLGTRIMNAKSSTRLNQHVKAPRSAVYRALLDARSVSQWMVPSGMTSQVHAFDAREGGRFRVSLTYDEPTGAGKTTAHTDTFHGRFVKLVPNKQVVEVVEFETTR